MWVRFHKTADLWYTMVIGRRSSAVEQLFRKQRVGGSNPFAGFLIGQQRRCQKLDTGKIASSCPG